MMCFEFDPSKFFEILVAALSTLFAAYLGAAYAFKLNRDASNATEKERQIGSFNRAIFLLSKQAEVVEGIRNTLLQEHRDHPGRHLIVPASLELDKTRFRIDSQPLGFLTDEHGVQLLSDTVLEDDRYEMIIASVNKRSEYHLEKFQPLLAGNNSFESAEYVETIVGRSVSATLKRSTDDIYHAVDSYLISNSKIIDRLISEFKRRFPGAKTLRPVDAVMASRLDETSLHALNDLSGSSGR